MIYDFTAYTYFAIKADTYEEACDKAEVWVASNIAVTDGWELDWEYVDERNDN